MSERDENPGLDASDLEHQRKPVGTARSHGVSGRKMKVEKETSRGS